MKYPQYKENEIIGLDEHGHVLQWTSKKRGKIIFTEKTPEEFGLKKIKEHEMRRILSAGY